MKKLLFIVLLQLIAFGLFLAPAKAETVLKLGGGIRAEAETRSNNGNSDTTSLNKVSQTGLINLSASVTKDVKGYIELRSFKGPWASPTVEYAVAVHKANIAIKNISIAGGLLKPVNVTFGRQDVKFGEGIVLNTTMDMLKITSGFSFLGHDIESMIMYGKGAEGGAYDSPVWKKRQDINFYGITSKTQVAGNEAALGLFLLRDYTDKFLFMNNTPATLGTVVYLDGNISGSLNFGLKYKGEVAFQGASYQYADPGSTFIFGMGLFAEAGYDLSVPVFDKATVAFQFALGTGNDTTVPNTNYTGFASPFEYLYYIPNPDNPVSVSLGEVNVMHPTGSGNAFADNTVVGQLMVTKLIARVEPKPYSLEANLILVNSMSKKHTLASYIGTELNLIAGYEFSNELQFGLIGSLYMAGKDFAFNYGPFKNRAEYPMESMLKTVVNFTF